MKKIFAMAFIALTTLSACTGNDDDSNNSDTVLVKKITSDAGTDYEETATFTYDGTKIKRITYDSSNYIKFTYTGDLLTLSESYEDGVLDQKQIFTYNEEGQLIDLKYYEIDSDDPSTDYFQRTTYVYNANGTISTTSYDDEAGTNVTSTGTLTVVNGNLVSFNNSNYSGTYTFDTKNNPFKNIKGYFAIILAGEEGGINNILSSNNDFDQVTTYTYTYNEDGYPVTETELNNNESSVTEYTY